MKTTPKTDITIKDKRLSTASMQDVLAGKKVFTNAGGDCSCSGSGGDGSGSCSSCGSCGSNTH